MTSSPSARKRAIAGAIVSISSRPIAPPSPACGLRPATARRGRVDAEALRHIARDDARGRDDQVAASARRRVGERDVDRHRHDRERARPDHHHRLRRAAPFARELAEKFGVAGEGEAGLVEDFLAIGLVTTARASPERT